MANRKPDYHVYVSQQKIVRGQEPQTFYKEVGAAWLVDRQGISIKLHALPIDGALVMFPPKNNENTESS